MKKLIEFLEQLEERNLYYQLNKIRDSILFEVVVPGEKWEVEFFEDNHIEIEKFKSEGVIHDEKEIEILFREFAD